MSSPINVMVTEYPTLAIYYDSEAEKREIHRRLSLMIPAGSGATLQETERQLDSHAWKIRWSDQRSAKTEVLAGVYSFPDNNLMLTGTRDSCGVPLVVLGKLEELHQKFLSDGRDQNPARQTRPSALEHPEFDLELHA